MVKFLAQETASGVLLLITTAIALLWANFGGDSYTNFWHTTIDIVIGDWHALQHDGHALSLDLWVNDVLMVLFFFVVGLEIKTELVTGDLREPRVAALPAIAALGGMIVPAGLYMALNAGGDGFGGWGIPMATDIAFAVGVLALMGPRAPQALKLFLLTLAIADDVGAIIVIAVFYSTGFSFQWFGLAIFGLVAMVVMRTLRVWYTPVYVLVGIFVWYATFRSGVHATIAGVAIGLITPAKPLLGDRAFEGLEDLMNGDASVGAVRDANWKVREAVPVTSRLINMLIPWTSFLIVPIFALANAGVKLSGDALSDAASSRITLGIIVGLVVGKPIGIALFARFALWSGVATMPRGITLSQILGVGAVAGIGFTVALFINGLAFTEATDRDQAVIGILVASALATALGYVLLSRAKPADDVTGSSSPQT